MPFKIAFSPEAQNDLHEIYDWYESKSPDLGERFIDDVEKRLFQLSHMPGIGPTKYDGIRCALIPDFPYLIHYNVNQTTEQIIVFRIFHTSRKPLWD